MSTQPHYIFTAQPPNSMQKIIWLSIDQRLTAIMVRFWVDQLSKLFEGSFCRVDSIYYPITMDCNNLGEVKHSNALAQLLRQAQADSLCSLKQLIHEILVQTKYKWVERYYIEKKAGINVT